MRKTLHDKNIFDVYRFPTTMELYCNLQYKLGQSVVQTDLDLFNVFSVS